MTHRELNPSIQDLCRLNDEDMQRVTTILALHNLYLVAIPDGQGYKVEIKNKKTQAIDPVSVSGYLQAQKLLAGFVFYGQHESDRRLDEKHSTVNVRRRAASEQASEILGEPIEYSFFSFKILERVLDTLTAQTIQKITGISKRQTDLFIENLRKLKLKPHLIVFDDYVIVSFEDESGGLIPIPADNSIEQFKEIASAKDTKKAWESWRQFLIQTEEEYLAALERQAELGEDFNQEITPPPTLLAGFMVKLPEKEKQKNQPRNRKNGKKEKKNKHQPPFEAFQPPFEEHQPPIEAFTLPSNEELREATAEFQRTTMFANAHIVAPFKGKAMRDFIKHIDHSTQRDQKPELDSRRRRKKTVVEKLQSLEQIKQTAYQILNPHLQKYGMKLIDAKSILQPGYEEAVKEKTLDIDVAFPIVDFLIIENNPNVLQLNYTSILGWRKDPKNPDHPSTLIPYGNVCGIVVIPEDMPLSERKKLIRKAYNELARSFPTKPKSMILTVTPKLIEEWKKNQEIVFPNLTGEELVASGVPATQAVDYGFYINKAEPPTVTASTYEPNSTHIGGTQIMVHVDRGDGVRNVIILDYGWIFDLVNTWSQLGQMPSPVDGITPFLRVGMFDKLPRLYREDLILQSLNDNVISQILLKAEGSASQSPKFESLEEFLVLETYHRFGADKFVNHLRIHFPHIMQGVLRLGKVKQLLNFLDQRKKIVYANKDIYDLVGLTHAHQDHSLGISLLNPDIPVGMTAKTRALLLADFRMASNWLAQDVAFIKERSKPMVGSAYQIRERNYLIINDQDRIEVSPGVFVTAIEVSHSIPGAVGFIVEVEHQGKVIARIGYPGDYKDGHFFREIGQRGPTDLLFVEGTNPSSAKKDSKFVTEKMVAQRLDGVFKDANKRGDLIIIDIPKNSHERLANIYKLAEKHGRDVILSAKMLRRIKLLNLAMAGDQTLPDIQPTNPRVLAWRPIKKQYTLEEHSSYEAFGAADKNTVSRRPGLFVLVRESSEAIHKLEGVGTAVTMVDSTYGAYSEAARKEKKYRRENAELHGWTLIDKGMHASGHTPVFRRDGNPHADESAPASLIYAQASIIVPIHTKKPGEIAETLIDYIDPEVTRIVKRRGHPRQVYKVD